MNRTIECFEFKGYKYDGKIASKVGSATYVKEDDEDCWIEIIPEHSTRVKYGDRHIVIYICNAEVVKVATFDTVGDSCNWGKPFEQFIEENIPAED